VKEKITKEIEMADRKLTDYSSEELAKALDKMTIISEEFEIFASIATDFFWERVARKPWFIIYESDENDINGREVETIDEVNEYYTETFAMDIKRYMF
jgi:hypothetical protein